MPFSLSGTSITQTGSDADLSGLAAIAGVTVSASASITRYSFEDLTLDIEGDLTIPNEQSLRITGGEGNSIIVRSGGSLTLGSRRVLTRNGQTLTANSQLASIEMLRGTSTRPFRTENRGMRITSGASFTMIGSMFTSNQSVYFEDGSTNLIEDGLFYFSSDINYQNIIIDSSDTIIDGIRLIDTDGAKLGIGIQKNLTQLVGFTPVGVSIVGHVGTGNEPVTLLTDYIAGSSTRTDVNLWNRNADPIFRINGSNIGNDLLVTGTGQQSSARGYVEHEVRFYPALSDVTGAPIIGAKCRLTDTDSGNRAATHETADRVYNLTSDAQGLLPLTQVLTAVWHNGGDVTTRSFYELDNRLPVQGFMISYSEVITAIAIAESNIADQNASIAMLPDFSVTEPDLSLVLAYTEIDTSEKLYDRAKAYLVDNYAGEGATIVARTGEIIDAGSLNVVIDALAPEAFAFDGTAITLRANTFTGSIITTGEVTLLNAARLDGGITDVNGIRVQITSDQPFNIVAARSDTGAQFGFLEGVTEAFYQVPVGVNVNFAAWQLGQQTLIGAVDTDASSSLALSWVPQTPVNTAIDVSAIIPTIDISLAPNDYSLTFNSPLEIDIETMKTVIHRLLGKEESLLVSLTLGAGNGAIDIEVDEVEIRLPTVFLRRGAALAPTDRVALNGFLNVDNAVAINPNYVINPSTPDGLFVLILPLKPALDPAQLAAAVWENVNGLATRDHARAANVQTKRDLTAMGV